jgi:hypothetical protein
LLIPSLCRGVPFCTRYSLTSLGVECHTVGSCSSYMTTSRPKLQGTSGSSRRASMGSDMRALHSKYCSTPRGVMATGLHGFGYGGSELCAHEDNLQGHNTGDGWVIGDITSKMPIEGEMFPCQPLISSQVFEFLTCFCFTSGKSQPQAYESRSSVHGRDGRSPFHVQV